MGKLERKVALITGGSDGIDLATAQLFLAAGSYVFTIGRWKEALDAAVKQLGGSPRNDSRKEWLAGPFEVATSR